MDILKFKPHELFVSMVENGFDKRDYRLYSLSIKNFLKIKNKLYVRRISICLYDDNVDYLHVNIENIKSRDYYVLKRDFYFIFYVGNLVFNFRKKSSQFRNVNLYKIFENKNQYLKWKLSI